MREDENQERVDKCGRENMKELEQPRKMQRWEQKKGWKEIESSDRTYS